jgi:hypothetical protein
LGFYGQYGTYDTALYFYGHWTATDGTYSFDAPGYQMFLLFGG